MKKDWNRTPNYKCVICGKACYQRPSAIKKSVNGLTCGKECGKINRTKHMVGKGNHQFGIKGADNASFLGEVKISRFGYRLIYKPEHIYSNHAGYVFEHILVMESHIGRTLIRPAERKNWEVCHHIDRNRLNNNINNLMLMTLSEHVELHSKEDDKSYMKAVGAKRRKLTDNQVNTIRARYNFGGITQQELAYEYGVGQTLIGNAINKRRYCYEK